jgi:hypothetical protein
MNCPVCNSPSNPKLNFCEICEFEFVTISLNASEELKNLVATRLTKHQKKYNEQKELKKQNSDLASKLEAKIREKEGVKAIINKQTIEIKQFSDQLSKIVEELNQTKLKIGQI